MAQSPVKHPHPQPQMRVAYQHDPAADVTCVETCQGMFPEIDPFLYPPGTNLLPTVYTNIFDSLGNEVPNTLPSTPKRPYNLHDCDPVITQLTSDQKRSPTEDLQDLLNAAPPLLTGLTDREYWGTYGDCTKPNETGAPLPDDQVDDVGLLSNVQSAIDILEGNAIADRVYSGFPLLHYNGGEKKGTLTQIVNELGEQIWNVDVHQIWYDSHIESDVSYLDLTALKGDDGQPSTKEVWTITYTIDVLSRGKDDFSPMTMYMDHPDFHPPQQHCDGSALEPLAHGGQRQFRIQVNKPAPVPNVAMDQTFFPIEEGTRTVLRVRMAPPAYFNLTYTWGWRQHPPRVQVMENASKHFPPDNPLNLYEQEVDVFGAARDVTKIRDRISDLSPAKRMWMALNDIKAQLEGGTPDYSACLVSLKEAWCSFQDWKDRNHLPRDVQVDPDTDLTLLYVNSTIYGQLSDGGWSDFPKWRTRGTQLKVTLINGDYYQRGYLNIDFGGARGWESQFKPTQKLGGSGCQFSFGRFYWSVNLAKPVMLAPATRDAGGKTVPTKHRVFITYNFEPSRRLRFYQFDPLHHDVAVYSLH